MVEFTINKKDDTVLDGLIINPTVSPTYSDDDDSIPQTFYGLSSNISEVSHRNYEKVSEIIKNMSRGGILEIGVARHNNANRSFSHAIINNKHDSDIYLGVDVDDKTFLNDINKNIFTIQTSSSNQDVVRNKIKEVGIDKLSVLFIDGYHSVNMAINDWKYSDLLSDNGIIIVHDTNGHPGPVVLLKSIDQTKYSIERLFTEFNDDYGLTIIRKKN